jgi:hypothetical protein
VPGGGHGQTRGVLALYSKLDLRNLLGYGEKERLIKEKVARRYDIPLSPRNISRSTLEKWIGDYKKAGYRIEDLYPQGRNDKGTSRALSSSLKLAIKELPSTSGILRPSTRMKFGNLM